MPELTGRVPITFANGISAEEMAGRLTAMCAFSESVRQYERELAGQRARAAQDAGEAEELREQLRSARRLQQDLLPDASAATFGRLSLRTLYRPAAMVSGDIYDVLAVDEQRVGVGLVDATGHDLAAALLSVYVIRALREMHSEPGTGVVEPDHVLARLNEELVQAELSDCQFVTASFAVCDSGTGQIRWSRGAAPYPILLRRAQPPQFLKTAGSLVGAFPDRHFERATLTLEPGDCLLFYTDGLEALLLHEGGRRVTDHLADTEWFRSLRGNRLAGHFDAINQRLDYTPPDAWPCDDVTLVAIECRE